MVRIALFAAVVATAAPVLAAPTGEAAVNRLVDRFVAAQRDFDQAALARLTAPDYVEISPVGEVDPRAKMLGFYAPGQKRAAPPMTLDERQVRITGDTAIATARLSFGPGAVRAVYVARRAGGEWRLVSTPFTSIRTRPAG